MRRTRFALVLPVVLPFLAAALVRADDAPKPDAPAKPAPVEAKPDPKPDAAKPDAAKPDALAIAWLHDYDAAKTKAAEEKKGLFVYLTPSWFT